MKRKGGLENEGLIGGILLFFVLMIVVSGLIFGFDYLGGIISIFPSFNQSGEVSVESGYVRFDLDSGKIEYYDSVSWIEVSGNLNINGKKFEQKSLNSDFSRFYLLNTNRQKDEEVLKLDNSAMGILYGSSTSLTSGRVVVREVDTKELLFDSTGNVNVGYGRIIADIYVSGPYHNDEKKDYFYLNKDNSLEFYKGRTNANIDYRRSLFVDIKKAMIKWRDSIYDYPTKFSYAGGEINVCVDLTNNRYLVANLNQEISVGQKC
jgi:hypothetical protein